MESKNWYAPSEVTVRKMTKAVLDALNGAAYEDDRQVVDEAIHKYYTTGEGFLVVRVCEAKV